MADEAFALSPINARASLPSDEDYEAISQAFMETSRGRWFLGEYAKRNRNADTRLVLDAVARIEQTIAAQKQEAADQGLGEALAAIRRALEKAQAAASFAVEGLALEEKLDPSARAPGSSTKSPGAGARSAPMAGSAISSIRKSAPSKPPARKSPRPARKPIWMPPSI